jgi:hypothetical protein
MLPHGGLLSSIYCICFDLRYARTFMHILPKPTHFSESIPCYCSSIIWKVVAGPIRLSLLLLSDILSIQGLDDIYTEHKYKRNMSTVCWNIKSQKCSIWRNILLLSLWTNWFTSLIVSISHLMRTHPPDRCSISRSWFKQHAHYTGAPCAGDSKRPVLSSCLRCLKLRQLAIGMVTAGISTRAVARSFNGNFSTISHQCFRECGSMSNLWACVWCLVGKWFAKCQGCEQCAPFVASRLL